jgi:hypothetical protein
MTFLKFLLITSFVFSTNSILLAEEVLNFEANYIIPVNSPLEENFSTYKLQDYKVRIFSPIEKKVSQLSYTLPVEMVGESTDVTLDLIATHDDVKYLSGEFATARCQGAWIQLKCEMRFHDLPIKLSKVETNLRDSGVSESEIKIRLEILSRFSGDPIGFTEIVSPL